VRVDLFVGKSQHSNAFATKFGVACYVVVLLLRVTATIQLNGDPGRIAIEVNDEPRDRLLPSEMEAGEAITAKLSP